MKLGFNIISYINTYLPIGLNPGKGADKLISLLGGEVELPSLGVKKGDIISQSRVFIPFSQLVKLFWRVSQILINLV